MLEYVEVEHVIGILFTLYGLTQLGISISGLGYASYALSNKFAEKTGYEPVDPSLFSRLFERFYYSQIHPFGERAMSGPSSWIPNWARYEWTVGLVVTFAATGLYVILSMVIFSGAAVSYYTMGFVPELAGLIETMAAFCLLCAISIIYYSMTVQRRERTC